MLELHSLFSGVKREVPPPEELRKYFNLYKELAEANGVKEFNYDSFVAGWTIGGNNVLKEKVLRLVHSKKQIGDVFWNDHTK